MTLKPITLAWRNLMRHKSFTFINLLGLSIGITCCLAITIFIRYEKSFDTYHQKASRTYRVVENFKSAEEVLHWNTTAYPLAEALRNDFREIPLVTQAAGPHHRLFKIEDEHGNVARYEEDRVLMVDPFYPQVFDFTWLAGNPEAALVQPNAVVLTESVALKYFGASMREKQSILGKHILLENKDELTVTGLIADAPPNTSLQYSLLIPYEFFKRNNTYSANNWSGNYQGTTFVTLQAGQSVQDLEHRIASWKKKYLKPEDDRRITYALQPITEAHNDIVYGAGPGSYTMPQKFIYAATGIAFFILLIACVNFINLSTAQAANRAKEVGIRKVMGSSRFGLVMQFLRENLLLLGFTLTASLALTQMALGYINQALAIINLHLAMDAQALLTALAIGVLVMMLACVYPAVVMASYRPIEALKRKFSSGSEQGITFRRSLIVFQFAIVQLFIIGTIVVAAQMKYFKNKDLGFSTDAIVTTYLHDQEHYETLRDQWLTHPAIADVSFSSSSPQASYQYRYGTSFRLPNQPEEEGQEAEMKGADLNYLSFYKLTLLAGRNFTKVEDDLKEFIVNEKLITALHWTPEQAIGQRLTINEGEGTIVGVVKDFHNESLQEEISPCVLINWKPFLELANIKIAKDQNMDEALAFIKKTWKAGSPDGIYSYVFLDDAIARKYAMQHLVYQGFTVFALLTISIGCLGLYGLLSFMALRKTKEVGIRKVLGASVAQIVGLFSKEFITLLFIAFVIAAPLAAYFMDGWLHDFAYRISLSWWMFALGMGLTVVIMLLTISYKSIKSALANPVEALRNE
ncbi:MacB-like core domain-containing protein [Chryseolinea serpens]|uniref:MacB-like core domain-containing protein n=1 Tax=Chryseolinea serpens TaxID=947013 RepID=A0A1M5TYY5_9BACT|nr:ABC transporter permease [Chryseolinea serpens]SHH55914.1 MacB-like core domain-containing protein [Chryseolinea serpens]